MSQRNGATALRKDLLVMRAALERAEMGETVSQLKHGLRWTALLKGAVPGFAATQGLPLLSQILRRYPFASTAVSFVASRFRPAVNLVTVLRFAVLAGLVWQGWQLTRGLRRGDKPVRRRKPRD